MVYGPQTNDFSCRNLDTHLFVRQEAFAGWFPKFKTSIMTTGPWRHLTNFGNKHGGCFTMMELHDWRSLIAAVFTLQSHYARHRTCNLNPNDHAQTKLVSRLNVKTKSNPFKHMPRAIPTKPNNMSLRHVIQQKTGEPSNHVIYPGHSWSASVPLDDTTLLSPYHLNYPTSPPSKAPNPLFDARIAESSGWSQKGLCFHARVGNMGKVVVVGKAKARTAQIVGISDETLRFPIGW